MVDDMASDKEPDKAFGQAFDWASDTAFDWALVRKDKVLHWHLKQYLRWLQS
jgi:hypothetical protein